MITSTANAQIKNLIQLQKKKKVRDEQGVFIAEGLKMYREAPSERIEKVYLSATLAEQETGRQIRREVNAEIVEDRIIKTVSDTQTPQGIITVVRRGRYKYEPIITAPAPLLLILENLQDPGNLGTIFRTAEGAGVTGIIMSRETVDIYNPKTIRATMGSIYRMPFSYHDDLSQVLADLKQQNIISYAAHLSGTAAYDTFDYRCGSAFLIGNEGAGLSEETAAGAANYLRIPMSGQVESLNASIAAAILIYEANRQRRK